VARPSKLTPDVHNEIVQAIKAGAYAEEAALHAGIDESTYYRWMARGRTELEQLDTTETLLADIGTKPSNRAKRAERTQLLKQRKTLQAEPRYREFCKAVLRASADAEVFATATIRRHMKDDWRAAAWYLERRYPQRWRRRESHEVAVGGSETGVPVQIVTGDLGDPTVTEKAHDLLRALRDAPSVDAADRADRPGASDR
jgi:transposase